MDFTLINTLGDFKAYLEELDEITAAAYDGKFLVHFGVHSDEMEFFEACESYEFETEGEALDWIDWRFYEFAEKHGYTDDSIAELFGE